MYTAIWCHLGDCVVPITSHVAGVVLTKLWRLALKVTTWAKMKPTRGRPLDQAKVYEAQPCKRSPENSKQSWCDMETTTTCVMQTSLWCFCVSVFLNGSGCVSSLSCGRYRRALSLPKVLFVCWAILLGSIPFLQIFGDQTSSRSGSQGRAHPGLQQIPLITLVPVASLPWHFSLCGRLGWWVDGRGCDPSFLDAISFWGRGRLRKEVLMCFAHFLVVIKL